MKGLVPRPGGSPRRTDWFCCFRGLIWKRCERKSITFRPSLSVVNATVGRVFFCSESLVRKASSVHLSTEFEGVQWTTTRGGTERSKLSKQSGRHPDHPCLLEYPMIHHDSDIEHPILLLNRGWFSGIFQCSFTSGV